MEVANILEQFADALEFKGESPFKIAAYRRASRVIAELKQDILDVWRQGRLKEIPGIGKALVEKLDQYLTTGRIRQFDELLAQVPKGLFDLLGIQNFGPKTAALAFKHLGVETVEDLRKVIEDGRLATLPGMGAKRLRISGKALNSMKLRNLAFPLEWHCRLSMK